VWIIKKGASNGKKHGVWGNFGISAKFDDTLPVSRTYGYYRINMGHYNRKGIGRVCRSDEVLSNTPFDYKPPKLEFAS
jgi:hypothetical protein